MSTACVATATTIAALPTPPNIIHPPSPAPLSSDDLPSAVPHHTPETSSRDVGADVYLDYHEPGTSLWFILLSFPYDLNREDEDEFAIEIRNFFPSPQPFNTYIVEVTIEDGHSYHLAGYLSASATTETPFLWHPPVAPRGIDATFRAFATQGTFAVAMLQPRPPNVSSGGTSETNQTIP